MLYYSERPGCLFPVVGAEGDQGEIVAGMEIARQKVSPTIAHGNRLGYILA